LKCLHHAHDRATRSTEETVGGRGNPSSIAERQVDCEGGGGALAVRQGLTRNRWCARLVRPRRHAQHRAVRCAVSCEWLRRSRPGGQHHILHSVGTNAASVVAALVSSAALQDPGTSKPTETVRARSKRTGGGGNKRTHSLVRAHVVVVVTAARRSPRGTERSTCTSGRPAHSHRATRVRARALTHLRICAGNECLPARAI